MSHNVEKLKSVSLKESSKEIDIHPSGTLYGYIYNILATKLNKKLINERLEDIKIRLKNESDEKIKLGYLSLNVSLYQESKIKSEVLDSLIIISLSSLNLKFHAEYDYLNSIFFNKYEDYISLDKIQEYDLQIMPLNRHYKMVSDILVYLSDNFIFSCDNIYDVQYNLKPISSKHKFDLVESSIE